MAFFVGIDPGLRGAIAVLSVDKTEFRIAQCWDLPTTVYVVNKTERPRYDLPKFLATICALQVFEPAAVVIENVAGRGNQVGGSMLSYGAGILHMAMEAAALPYEIVRPEVWKAYLRCPASKSRTVRIAEKTFAGRGGELFRGPKGGGLDGRAEAALMAYWVWKKRG